MNEAPTEAELKVSLVAIYETLRSISTTLDAFLAHARDVESGVDPARPIPHLPALAMMQEIARAARL